MEGSVSLPWLLLLLLFCPSCELSSLTSSPPKQMITLTDPSCCTSTPVSCPATVSTQVFLDKRDIMLPCTNESLSFTTMMPGGSQYYEQGQNSAVLTLNGSNIYGNLKVGGKLLTLDSNTSGHLLAEDEDEEYSEEDEGDDEGDPPEEATDFTTMSFISAMIYYTRDFASITADITGFVFSMLEAANTGFRASKVMMTIVPHCILETNLTEKFDRKAMMSSFQGSRGTMEELRGTADVAVLLVSNMNRCGRAVVHAVASTDPKSAMVVRKDCVDSFTFGHELAHLVGSAHHSSSSPAYPYGKGFNWVGPGGDWFSSILESRNGRTRVNLFSNPNINFNNTQIKTGNKVTGDNARLLNRNRQALARVGNETRVCTNAKGTILSCLLTFSTSTTYCVDAIQRREEELVEKMERNVKEKEDKLKKEIDKKEDKLKKEIDKKEENLKKEFDKKEIDLKNEMVKKDKDLKKEMDKKNEDLKKDMDRKEKDLKEEMKKKDEDLKRDMDKKEKDLKKEMDNQLRKLQVVMEGKVEEVKATLEKKFDPCTSYRELSSSTRHKTTRDSEGVQAACGGTSCCDDSHHSRYESHTGIHPDWAGPQWYRFLGAAGSKMIESNPGRYYGGTTFPGWLVGGHPSPGEQVTRTVQFTGSKTVEVLVYNCFGYYVYKLPNVPICNLGYCGE